MALKPIGYRVDDDVEVLLENDLVALKYNGAKVLVSMPAIPDLIKAIQQVVRDAE